MLMEIIGISVFLTPIGFVCERIAPWRVRAGLLSLDRPPTRQRAFWLEVGKLFLGGTLGYVGYEVSKRLLFDQPRIAGWDELTHLLAVPFFVVAGYVISYLYRRRE